jgi:hypothetical protein
VGFYPCDEETHKRSKQKSGHRLADMKLVLCRRHRTQRFQEPLHGYIERCLEDEKTSTLLRAAAMRTRPAQQEAREARGLTERGVPTPQASATWTHTTVTL